MQKMVWGPGYDNLTVAITISSSSWASVSQLPDLTSQNSMFWIFIWHFEFLCLLCSGNNKARQSVIEKRRGINSKLLFWAYIGENSNVRGNDGHLCLDSEHVKQKQMCWNSPKVWQKYPTLRTKTPALFTITTNFFPTKSWLQSAWLFFVQTPKWGQKKLRRYLNFLL